MKNDLLILLKKHTDTLIEQTETKPQGTIGFEMNKAMQTFSFSPPINLVEESKWLLDVTSFEWTKSVFNLTNENNSFSITTPGHWETKSAEKNIDELNNLLEIRFQNGIELLVEQVRKKGWIIIKDYSLSSLGTFENEVLEDLKSSKYDDLEDLVYRFQLTNDEIVDKLDGKYIVGSTKRYTLPFGIYETTDIIKTLESLLPKDVEVNITIDDVRLKSNLTTNKAIRFTKKSFFYVILGFIQSH